ncbi:Epi-inositol hydrolase [Klebsiella michiganensis]|nr:Epi-inositol hydrolase [Klebsiella michiganensis]
MGKLRLTMAQALVKFLDNQYLEVDGEEHKFVKGIFAILATATCWEWARPLNKIAVKCGSIRGVTSKGWRMSPPVLPDSLCVVRLLPAPPPLAPARRI